MTSIDRTLEPDALYRVLVEQIGVDADLLAADPGATLAELGVDSIAQVELGVVLRSNYGVESLPEEAGTMSPHELASRLVVAEPARDPAGADATAAK